MAATSLGEALLAHSTTVAACAQAIAARSGRLPPAEAFLAGLLHDFGLLVEWRLAAVRGALPRDPQLHQRFAGVVLTQWQLPPGVVEAAQSHHCPGAGGIAAACVRLAHAMAAEAGHAEPCEQEPAEPAAADAGDLARLGFDGAAWSAWCADARQGVLDAAEALQA